MKNPDELTDYLGEIVQRIEEWTNGVITAKAKHRLGDEIIFVGEHFFSAYVIASYIKKCWKYEQHPPYFGATFGYVDRAVASISNLDTWNHRLIKQARTAVERLKKAPHEHWYTFEKEVSSEEEILSYEILCSQVETQQVLSSKQTKPQQMACTLYSLFHKQNEVAHVLQKSNSTISNQLKQGLCDSVIVLEISAGAALVMHEYRNLQGTELERDAILEKMRIKFNDLHQSTQERMKKNLSTYFDFL